MKKEIYYSLKLGFNSKSAVLIEKSGIRKFVNQLLAAPLLAERPETLLIGPKSQKGLRVLKQLSQPEKVKMMMEERQRMMKLQLWWLKRMHTSKNPLQEKMTFFWHNHFVSSAEKVVLCNLVYEQNNLFRKNAFGNFKALTLEVLYNNALLDYLDNSKNIAGNPNENLGRELLELFTLGAGNYSEQDVKEAARALAGLASGETKGGYNPKHEDNGEKTFLGKTGNLKAVDIVNAIFEYPKAGYRLSEKLLKQFATDTPSDELIAEYGDYFRTMKYELKPMLLKVFTDERFRESKGLSIKDPIVFMLESLNILNIKLEELPDSGVSHYLRIQGLDIFNPPNVKGWTGGMDWLDSEKLVQRNVAISLLCKGNLPFRNKKAAAARMNEERESKRDAKKNNVLKPSVDWNTKAANNKEVIQELSQKLVYQQSNSMQEEMEQILDHDFDPSKPNAYEGVLRIAEYLMKTPEFQLI
jgi:uncharacterized protein (DUF1800 family)